MNEQDWLIIKTLFKEKNITKAATILYTSQPSLSYRIQQIEKKLGVRLFTTDNKKLQFTYEGEYLAHCANNMLLEYKKIRNYLANISSDQKTLKIGASSNFTMYKLPDILHNFGEKYPDIRFNIKSSSSPKIFNLFTNKEVQMGFIRGEVKYEPKILIDNEHFCIISKNKIDIEDLPNTPRVFLHTTPVIVQLIEKWWNERFTNPPFITVEVDKTENCKEMVMKGLGYAIVPGICIHPDDKLYVKKLKLTNGEYLTWKTWFVYSQNLLKYPVPKQFIEFIKDKYSFFNNDE